MSARRRSDADTSGGQPPPAPDPQDPFASAWSGELDCYCLKLKQAVPHLRIKAGAILFASKVEPEAGDIVVCDVSGHPSRVYVGRFIRRDGFRVLLDRAGVEQIATPKTVLVVTSIVNPEGE